MSVDVQRDMTRRGITAFTFPHVVAAPTVVPAGTTLYVPRYVEIAAGQSLEIGLDADVEIG